MPTSEGKIVLSRDSVGVERERQTLWRTRFADIVRIEAYKRDQVTVDLICFDIWFEAEGEQWLGLVHEDLPGWKELMERFGALQGFDRDWFAKVSQPPFAECRTVVYDKVRGTSRGGHV